MRTVVYLIFVLISTFSGSVFAYIGPGLGAGTVGVILGVIGSILLALFAIFWYPLKRLIKKFKKPQPEVENEALQSAEEDVVSSEDNNKAK